MTPEDIRNNIHGNLKTHISAHRHSRARSVVQKIVVGMLVSVLAIGSILMLMLFVEQSRIAQIFNPFIGLSLVGYVWMWFPELLLASLVFLGIAIMVMQLADFNYQMFLKVAAPTYLLLAVLSLVFTPITSTIAETLNFQSLTTSEYRLSIRDWYVDELDKTNEFFGVVRDSSCLPDNGTSTLSINHGGVIKEFEVSTDDCKIIAEGSPLIWVAYSEHTITDYELL
jgi:hypothetical protein